VRPTNIVLYQAEWCGYCARVRAKLTDLLLDYKVVNVPPSHALRTVVREVSGQTSIPVMVDGDVVLDDDDDIIPYLERTHGQKAAVYSAAIPPATSAPVIVASALTTSLSIARIPRTTEVALPQMCGSVSHSRWQRLQ